uniref:J domain-containing protein n=1 Tax=Chlamydomonas leiostraca TaxID=1034604 RepID=A0A7S0WPS9_9CHLO|mmetsp:Transcript_22624/g.57561  ORF Transcript_22624/g.57561 Transcript_22624/m.57561 type:complete len:251 (+) Transcript_22624:81-833(+)
MADTTRDDIAAALDQEVSNLCDALHGIEVKALSGHAKVLAAEESSIDSQLRLAQLEETVAKLKAQGRERELALYQEVVRLETLLKAEKMQGALASSRAHALLADVERLRCMRDEAAIARDAALGELAGAYADMEAMQATLQDSAIYVRYLRKKVLELEIESSRNAARALSGGGAGRDDAQGAFSMASIRASVQAAVREACECGEEEKRRRLRQLQLRWHPDKNPVLTEFATEVTKLINEAVAQAEAGGSK